MQNAQSDKHKFIMKSRGFKANRSQYIKPLLSWFELEIGDLITCISKWS